MAPKSNICPGCFAPITTALVYHQEQDLHAALVAGVWGGWPNGGPVLRITCPDAPVPHSEALERRFVPSPEYVAEQTSQLIETGRPPAPWWAREEKS